jgi:hypothetical protein
MGKCRENAPQKKRCRENEGGRRRRRRGEVYFLQIKEGNASTIKLGLGPGPTKKTILRISFKRRTRKIASFELS